MEEEHDYWMLLFRLYAAIHFGLTRDQPFKYLIIQGYNGVGG